MNFYKLFLLIFFPCKLLMLLSFFIEELEDSLKMNLNEISFIIHEIIIIKMIIHWTNGWTYDTCQFQSIATNAVHPNSSLSVSGTPTSFLSSIFLKRTTNEKEQKVTKTIHCHGLGPCCASPRIKLVDCRMY